MCLRSGTGTVLPHIDHIALRFSCCMIVGTEQQFQKGEGILALENSCSIRGYV